MLPDCYHFSVTRVAIGHVLFGSSNPLFGDLEGRVYLSDCIFLHAGEHVRVQVERDPDLAVTEPLAGLHVDAGRQHVGGVAVPQIVEPNARQSLARNRL
jgi:hypothetical protein